MRDGEICTVKDGTFHQAIFMHEDYTIFLGSNYVVPNKRVLCGIYTSSYNLAEVLVRKLTAYNLLGEHVTYVEVLASQVLPKHLEDGLPGYFFTPNGMASIESSKSQPDQD